MQRLRDVADEVERPLESLLAINVGFVCAVVEVSDTTVEDRSLVCDLLDYAAGFLAVAVVIEVAEAWWLVICC